MDIYNNMHATRTDLLPFFNLVHIQLFELVCGIIKITCTCGCDSKIHSNVGNPHEVLETKGLVLSFS